MIKKYIITTVLFLLISNLLIAQKKQFGILKDTTIYFNELVFNNALEKQTFKAIYLNESKDYFSLIYMAHKVVNEKEVETAKAKIYRKINNYKSKNIKAKGEKKSVKIIYKDVHNEFFKKYELINHFEDIFNQGYYNCLSATFIYSLIMEELQIPYQINIFPSHVNLTTYPETHKILIETTDPIKGYIKYDKKFKEDYVNNLIAYKLIEEDEAKINSIDNLFEKYYNTNEIVTIKQLVGTQYYNEGVYLLEKEEFESAVNKLEKSIALYPSKTAAQILMSLYGEVIKKADFKETKNIDYLIKFSRYKELRENIDEGLIAEFGTIADNYLIEKKDTDTFKKVYQKLSPTIKNAATKKRIDYIYLAAYGEHLFNELNYKEASQYFLKGLNLVGDTNHLEDYYMRSVVLQMSGMTNMEDVVELLATAETDYKNIVKNKMFMSAKSRLITFLMIRSFEQNNIKEGNKYRVQLEDILDHIDVKKDEESIGVAYAEAGSCYFRRGMKSKSRELFKKGLEYAPKHYELESRLRMLNY